MKCFLCHNSNLTSVYKLPDKTILKCSHDGLYLADEKQSNRLYTKAYYQGYPYSTISNLNKRYFKSKLATIQLLTKEDAPRILDAGCGWGDFLEVLHREQISYDGIDISDAAIEICRKRGLRCQKATIQDLARREYNRYSAVVSFQTIEHITNPLPFLKTAHTLLRPDGVILLTTPNHNTPLRTLFGSRWSVYNIESHFVFYNKNTLRKTLEETGFSGTTIKIDTPRFFAIGYILSRLINKKLHSKFSILNSILSLPFPTDPLGDLEAVGFKDGQNLSENTEARQ